MPLDVIVIMSVSQLNLVENVRLQENQDCFHREFGSKTTH